MYKLGSIYCLFCVFFCGGVIKQFEEYFSALGEITYIIDFLFSSPRLGHLRPFPPCPSPRFTSHTLAPHCCEPCGETVWSTVSTTTTTTGEKMIKLPPHPLPSPPQARSGSCAAPAAAAVHSHFFQSSLKTSRNFITSK